MMIAELEPGRIRIVVWSKGPEAGDPAVLDSMPIFADSELEPCREHRHEPKPIEDILAELLAQYQPLCGSIRLDQLDDRSPASQIRPADGCDP
jgi:hypothetical protein